MNSRTHGFTLPELMITLALAAVILGIGAPSFQQFRLNNRLSNTANDLLSVITVARTEAIKRQRNVAVCRTDTPASTDPKCSATSTAGFIVFDDADGNCVRGAQASEPLISARSFDTSLTNNALRVKTDGNCLQFGPSGFRNDFGAQTLNHISVCDDRGLGKLPGQSVSGGRGILITKTGRARVTRAVGTGNPDDVTSADWAGVACP